jgi:hypothetical protein
MSLKSCPFCGAKNAPGATCLEALVHGRCVDPAAPSLPDPVQLAVNCISCGAFGPWVTRKGPNRVAEGKGMAEREWNDRSRAARGAGNV